MYDAHPRWGKQLFYYWQQNKKAKKVLKNACHTV